MKTKTLTLLAKYINNNQVKFPEYKDSITLVLNRTEMRQIIAAEYGKAPKKKRKIKVYIKRVFDTFLMEVVEDLKECNNANS